nr:hypothetical protein CFP56_57404 [Quercus suber]
MNAPVEQNGDHFPSVVLAQTKVAARFQEAFNEASVEPDTADVTAELVKSGGRDSGETFEERLNEIDMELGRFDKLRGELLRDNTEEEIMGTKDSNPMQDRDGTSLLTPLLEDLCDHGNLKEWVGKKGGTEASLGNQEKVQSLVQAETLVGSQWETAHLQDVDEVHVGALEPIKELEAKEGGPTYVGSVLGLSSMCYVEGKGWIAETPGPSGKNWKRLARGAKPKSNSEGKSPLIVKKEALTPLQHLDPNIKDLHDTPNSLQASENNVGMTQAKWRRFPRMEVGTSPINDGLAGSKRPMDMTSDLNELPSKKILVSHSNKENHLILAMAGSQPRQEL